MPYVLPPEHPTEPCTVCGSPANIHRKEFGVGTVVDCARCGDFQISRTTVDDLWLRNPKDRGLASYFIRKMQTAEPRPTLTTEFFESLRRRILPTPAEAIDNLVMWLADRADGRPGNEIEIAYADPALLGIVGVVEPEDVGWIVESLTSQQLLLGTTKADRHIGGKLTASGWQRFEELKRAHVSSRYAFFARRFSNTELDEVFERCLFPAVKQTGYELRTVPQRAGLIDAVIEDEIRRCRFLVADLSDDNAGAYWEAGFAEGLGKPVIYVCCAEKDSVPMKTHFDTDHRQTVRWDLASLDQTATQLKAVIRNTLLGDAKQTD